MDQQELKEGQEPQEQDLLEEGLDLLEEGLDLLEEDPLEEVDHLNVNYLEE